MNKATLLSEMIIENG